MIDPLQLLLQQTGNATNAFAPTSRYYGIATGILESQDDEPVAYVRRRWIAQPEQYFLLQQHTVNEGERPDTLANTYLGDPEQFWRLCDANAVMEATDLTDTPGQKIRITLPEGVPGYNNG